MRGLGEPHGIEPAGVARPGLGVSPAVLSVAACGVLQLYRDAPPAPETTSRPHR